MKYINLITLVLLTATILIAWYKPVKEVNNEHFTKEIQQVLVRDTIRITKIDTVVITDTTYKVTTSPGFCIGTRTTFAYDIDERDDNNEWQININGWISNSKEEAKLLCDGVLKYDIDYYDGEPDTTNYECKGYWLFKFKEVIEED